jgi:hypothetical protein
MMPHAFTWPATGDTIPTHPKPPEGGYYGNWDPYAGTIELEPVTDVNPVRTQHVLVATGKDKEGKPLPNRRVEWSISNGSVATSSRFDESGYPGVVVATIGQPFRVSHTNNFSHVLIVETTILDDIHLTAGQTLCDHFSS